MMFSSWNWLNNQAAEAKRFLGIGLSYSDIFKMITIQKGDKVYLNRTYILQASCPPEDRQLRWIEAKCYERYPTYVVFQTPQYKVAVHNTDLVLQEERIIKRAL